MESHLERLSSFTFAVLHNPNCSKPFELRLVGHHMAQLDLKPGMVTGDICGYGDTMEEAAEDCWKKKFGDTET